MFTPLKGDAASIPLNDAARKIVDAWDPAKDEAAGEQCRSYGAPAIMRVPGRLHITWQDDNTLKIETDAGTQTRLLHFTGQAPKDGAPSWQGYSAANWERPGAVGGGLGMQTRNGQKSRTLDVTTTQLRPGYLRKNGIPYSGTQRDGVLRSLGGAERTGMVHGDDRGHRSAVSGDSVCHDHRFQERTGRIEVQSQAVFGKVRIPCHTR